MNNLEGALKFIESELLWMQEEGVEKMPIKQFEKSLNEKLKLLKVSFGLIEDSYGLNKASIHIGATLNMKEVGNYIHAKKHAKAFNEMVKKYEYES